MTRIEFIKKLMVMGVGLPSASALLSSCDNSTISDLNFEKNFNGKVLVIGAGAAGLTAAYLLNRSGIDVQVIEAAADFGGRVKKNTELADFPIDLGGEWIHTDPKVLAEILSDPSVDADVEIVTYNPQSIYNYKENGKLKKQNWAKNFYSEYKFKRTTWYGFFEKHIVPSISDKIALNSPVENIDYSNDKVVVTTTNGNSYEADKVIITVPVKILQSDIISFSPALPSDKTEAINNIDMPDGLKAFIEFKERFYPDILLFGNLFAALTQENKIYYDAAFRKDSDRHVLGLFSVGDAAKEFTQLKDDQAVVDEILRQLDEIFDGKASKNYVNHVVQNWSKEPYIQGSYSYDYYGSRNRIIETIVEPVNNQLFFAGEALSIDNGSTVHGAALSAYDAVEALLKNG